MAAIILLVMVYDIVTAFPSPSVVCRWLSDLLMDAKSLSAISAACSDSVGALLM
jgi:hypothetical protein